MNKSFHKGRIFLVLLAMLSLSIHTAFSQEAGEQKKVRIQIEKTEAGQTTRIDTTIIVGQETDVDELLRKLEEENQMLDMDSFDEDDDQMEVIIRKKGYSNYGLNIDVDVLNEKHEKLMEQVDSLLESSLKNINTGQAFLGIYFENIASEGEETEAVQGVKITKVIEGTAARKAGLKEGDIITAIDETPIEITDDLYHTIQTYEPGTMVKVHLIRDGQSQTVDATLGRRNYTIQVPALPEFKMQESFQYDLEDDNAEEAEQSEKPFLGVYINTSDEAVKEGIKVIRVIEGTTAEKMGLKSGDVILEVNGNSVNSLEDLKSELNQMEVGEQVKVKYLRDGKTAKSKEKIQGKPVQRRIQMRFHNGNLVPAPPSAPRPPSAPQPRSSATVKEYRIVITQEDISADEAKMLAPDAPNTFSGKNTLALDDFSFAPNPNSGRFNVSFTLPDEGDTQIRIFDAAGKQIYIQDLERFKGTFTQQLDISENPQGVYYLQVRQNNKTFNQKILVQ